MGDEPIDVVMKVFPPEIRGGQRDMCEAVEDETLWQEIAELFEPDAEVRFLTPDSGLMGGMSGPFRGAAGFRAGWREWLQPFDRFRIELGDVKVASNGRILLLATTFGTMRGSPVEVEQPSAAVYKVQDGRITEADHYLEHQQALKDAGLS